MATPPYRAGETRLAGVVIGLAKDDVRGAVAWQFANVLRARGDTNNHDGDELAPWPHFGPAFFEEVWPLEPASQSSQSANDFARVPARVGARYFEEALKCVLPYLLQFEVWSVHSDFGLDPKEPATKELLELFPAQILTLISACISPKSGAWNFRIE